MNFLEQTVYVVMEQDWNDMGDFYTHEDHILGIYADKKRAEDRAVSAWEEYVGESDKDCYVEYYDDDKKDLFCISDCGKYEVVVYHYPLIGTERR